MHTRNFGFLLPNEVVIYDFGGVLRLDDCQIDVLKNWVLRGQVEKTLETLESLGFDSTKLSHLSTDAGKALGSLLLKPILSSQPFDFGSWNLQKSLDEALGGDKWWFRMAGPPWFLILMRSLHGLVKVTQQLGVSLQVRELVESEWGRVDSKPEVPLVVNPGGSLKVKVFEDDQIKVALEMPASAAGRLREVLTPELVDKLVRRGIDLEGIENRARESGFAAQDLFEHEEGRKRYRVFLA